MQRFILLSLGVVLQLAAMQPLCAQSRSAIPAAKGEVVTPVPAVASDSLPNGLRYFLTRVNDVPIAEISIIVDAGLSCEHSGESGLAFVTSQLLLAGSEKRTRQMMDDFLHEQATVLLPYTHYDYSQLYVKTLNRNFSTSMDVAADALINPTFNAQELAVLKTESRTRLPDQTLGAGSKATKELIGMLCGEASVLGRRLQPMQSEIDPITVQQVREFHQRCYTPERTTVVVTGDLDPAFVRTVLTERFGGWKRGATPRGTITPITKAASRNIILDDTSTVHNLAYFRLGVTAIPQSDRRFPALVVLNRILGEGNDSRLRSALWGRHVVSPSFISNIGVARECSYLIISGSTSPVLADSVIILVKNELQALATDGITVEELNRVREELLRDSPLMFASNRNLQSLLKEAAVYGSPVQEVFSFADRLREMRPEDVNGLARELFDASRLCIVVLGNAFTLRKPLSSVLGSVPVKRAQIE
ncbi:MAG: insulinase family protein [Bacteroidia bacterium]|nr:insulinase family protein [Bacteroidia bacterium]